MFHTKIKKKARQTIDYILEDFKEKKKEKRERERNTYYKLVESSCRPHRKNSL